MAQAFELAQQFRLELILCGEDERRLVRVGDVIGERVAPEPGQKRDDLCFEASRDGIGFERGLELLAANREQFSGLTGIEHCLPSASNVPELCASRRAARQAHELEQRAARSREILASDHELGPDASTERRAE